ncbi:MAG: IS256 family transposase, partial [Caldiserica bacterium]|nr:IS256 family transposase [Caldisericota bacterium]
MEKKKKAPKPEEVRARIKELVQQTLQEALEAELEEFLGYSKHQRSDNDNSRNGYNPKTVRTDTGEVEINVP